MEHRHKVFPIQVIVPHTSNPNSFRLNESGLHSVLGHSAIANKKVVIVSVAGATRKGKSFLLNFFLEYLYALQNSQQNDIQLEWLDEAVQLQGFHWRSGAKRDTVGIWLWGEPIMIEAANGEKYAIVLMDCQGITLENAQSSNQCSSIFALSTLLSCIQCYNIVDVIQEDSLQNLSLFVEYGRLFLNEAQQFGKPFQNLVFMVRDHKSPEEFPFGAEGGEAYFEQVLENCPDSLEELKVVKDNLRECFEQIFCYLLPHPGQKVADRNSFKGYVKDIRPMFREEVKKMISSLLNPHAIKPKIVNGKEVTCKKMIEYIRECARLFYKNDNPAPRSILNAHAQLLCIESAIEAKTAYCRGMDRATSAPRMLSEKKLLEAHIKHGITALNIYDKCPKIGSGEVRTENLARLQEDINAELEKYKRFNEAKRVNSCASAMLACGDSVLFGIGLGGAASGAVAASVVTLQLGMVSAGIVAIPISLSTLFGIWLYVTVKECSKRRKERKNN
uniref:GB1/RHD3-type G domain-containing protein n=1 Tax=Acrobeloides nanus TaxID=290746 RepID=A0A914CLN2_9BILA